MIDEFGTFEIAVEDVPLPQVLNMLAIQSRRNIITSKRVGVVAITANLFDVTFYEALDSILHIASLCYEEHGNFIYVMTCEEKSQRARANRVLEDRVFYLDHISPGDAESLAKPLLSEKGTMSKLGEVEGGFAPGQTEAGGDAWAHEPVLVVRDFEENIAAISALLTDVDTPPTQVMVESTILVTSAKGDYAWGMDVSVLLKADFTSLLNPLNPVSYLQNLQQQAATSVSGTELLTPQDNAIGMQSTVGATTESGGFKFGILNENVAVFMRLLDEVSDTTILARPKILALNRQRAQVLVGERVAYLSTTQTETATTQSVQFLDTGINLILRPFISRDGSIRMELYPSVSEYTIRKIGDPISPGYTEIPNETTHEITTNVRVRDGETLVLGGLFKDKATINRRSVPGLGDVPLFGNAFKGQDDDVTRQEIIFLVTPTIVREEVMSDASKEANDLVSNVLVGVREGLLPWARETLAANYNHDAYEAVEFGKVDLAISHINRSLRNNPNQPEMVRMRGELMGERSIHGDDGDVLRRVFDRAFRGQGIDDEEDEGVIEPVSDPLSGRIKEETSTFEAAESLDPFMVVEQEKELTALEVPVAPQETVEVAESEMQVEADTDTDVVDAFEPEHEAESVAAADPETGAVVDAEASEDFETEADAVTEADTEAAVDQLVFSDEGPGFNMFTDLMFRTRLVDWWFMQSKRVGRQDETVVSVDPE
jgi:type IV pilus assembly protein PilQ